MSKKDIIFYSNYCTYSKEIINQISKTPINDNIIYVSVDDENIQLPPFIKAVPTIYLVNDKKIVVDEEINDWIKSKISKPVDDTLQPYFGTCDNSYSSACSSIDNKEMKPFISSYTFLGDEQKIETPKDGNNSQGSKGSSQGSSQNSYASNSLSQKYEQFQNSRNSEFKPMQRS